MALRLEEASGAFTALVLQMGLKIRQIVDSKTGENLLLERQVAT